MSTRTPASPRYTLHDGFRMPMGFPTEAFSSAQRYRPQPTDVFVCTYPKCGTTWMQYIVYLLMHEGQPLTAQQALGDVFPHLEEVGAQTLEALPQPRLIKTHLPFSMVPRGPGAKYVYVARNPFDCAVSFFHHTRGFVQHYDFADGTFDTFFECFLAGEVDFGDYFEHLLSWYRHRDDDTVLFVTYESMQRDVEAAIVAVGEFLGGTAAAAARDPVLRAGILKSSSFTGMSKDQRRWSSERAEGMPEFVRKGVVGDWRNHFSAEQARRLADAFARHTGKTGPYGLWPEILAEARNG